MKRARSRFIIFAFLAAFLSGCGGDRFDDLRNIRSPGEAIICFGDSLTEGVGAGSGEDYPAVLSHELGRPVINAGQRGDTTASALSEFPTRY